MSARQGGKIVVEFDGSASNNQIKREISARDGGVNTISFKQGKKNEILGKVFAENGTNKISFNKGQSEIRGTISAISTAAGSALNELKLAGGVQATLLGSITAKGSNAKNTITFTSDNAGSQAKLILKGTRNNIAELKAENTKSYLELGAENQTTTIGKIIQGENLNINLTSSRVTLELKDAKNTILGLNASLRRTNSSVIDITSGRVGDGLADRHFRVLEIGKKDSTNASEGLLAGGFTFKVFADKNATQGGSTTIGGEKVESTGSANYGYAYSDRVIIHKASVSAKSQNLAVVIDPNQVKTIRRTSGGTEVSGNIAVATVKNDSANASVDFNAQHIVNGGERIEVDLRAETTDEKGKKSSSGNYTTYFVAGARSLGVTQEVQMVASSGVGVNPNIYLSNLNSLNKRMGELRNNANAQGVWARVFGGTQVSNFGLEASTNYVTLQGGYDYALDYVEAKNYLGVAVAYLHSAGRTTQARIAGSVVVGAENVGLDDIQSSGVELGVYSSYVTDEGWYNDLIAKISFIGSSFLLGNDQANRSSTNAWGASLSNELGYRYFLGETRNYYIDPQVEVSVGYLDRTGFEGQIKTNSTTNKLSVFQPHVLVVRTRAGASFGKVIAEAEKNVKTSLYVGGFYEYDFINAAKSEIISGSGAKTFIDPLSSNGRFVLNLGSNIELDKQSRLYIDLQKSFGSKYRTEIQINIGGRYGF